MRETVSYPERRWVTGDEGHGCVLAVEVELKLSRDSNQGGATRARVNIVVPGARRSK